MLRQPFSTVFFLFADSYPPQSLVVLILTSSLLLRACVWNSHQKMNGDAHLQDQKENKLIIRIMYLLSPEWYFFAPSYIYLLAPTACLTYIQKIVAAFISRLLELHDLTKNFFSYKIFLHFQKANLFFVKTIYWSTLETAVESKQTPVNIKILSDLS